MTRTAALLAALVDRLPEPLLLRAVDLLPVEVGLAVAIRRQRPTISDLRSIRAALHQAAEPLHPPRR